MASCWPSPAVAQRQREWAVNVSPELGYAWADTHFQGRLQEPGRLTTVDTRGQLTGPSLGFSAAVSHRFWSRDRLTALGPILALSIGNASDASAELAVRGQSEQAAARRVEPELYSRVERFSAQGGVSLTMLHGLLEGRLLFGGGFVSVTSPELEAPNSSGLAAFTSSIGGRVRLPFAERWVVFAGARGDYAKYMAMSGGLTACAAELGLEWVFPR